MVIIVYVSQEIFIDYMLPVFDAQKFCRYIWRRLENSQTINLQTRR